MTAGPPPRSGDRTVRRALGAGVIVWAVGAAVFAVGLAPAGGAAVLAGVLLALSAGGIVASGWLLIALALDVHAGQRPSRRRLLWTAGVTTFTVLSPLLVVAAGG